MKKARVGITDESSLLIEALLTTDQIVPQNSLFRDDLFDTACEKIQCEINHTPNNLVIEPNY